MQRIAELEFRRRKDYLPERSGCALHVGCDGSQRLVAAVGNRSDPLTMVDCELQRSRTENGMGGEYALRGAAVSRARGAGWCFASWLSEGV